MKNIQAKLQTFAGAMMVPIILLVLVGFFVGIGIYKLHSAGRKHPVQSVHYDYQFGIHVHEQSAAMVRRGNCLHSCQEGEGMGSICGSDLILLLHEGDRRMGCIGRMDR